jgi:hypothetical protein
MFVFEVVHCSWEKVTSLLNINVKYLSYCIALTYEATFWYNETLLTYHL